MIWNFGAESDDLSRKTRLFMSALSAVTQSSLQKHANTHAKPSLWFPVDHRDLPETIQVSYFHTETDMRCADPETDRGEPTWHGPGFYAFWSIQRPCARGCCDQEEWYEAEPLDEFRVRLTTSERESLKEIVGQLPSQINEELAQ
jgi:hypothetical protein